MGVCPAIPLFATMGNLRLCLGFSFILWPCGLEDIRFLVPLNIHFTFSAARPSFMTFYSDWLNRHWVSHPPLRTPRLGRSKFGSHALWSRGCAVPSGSPSHDRYVFLLATPLFPWEFPYWRVRYRLVEPVRQPFLIWTQSSQRDILWVLLRHFLGLWISITLLSFLPFLPFFFPICNFLWSFWNAWEHQLIFMVPI